MKTPEPGSLRLGHTVTVHGKLPNDYATQAPSTKGTCTPYLLAEKLLFTMCEKEVG